MVAFNHLVLLVTSLLPIGSLAHPGHDVRAEVAQRAAYMAKAERRSLAHCADKLKERGITQRSIARRQAAVESLRTKRSLDTRDFNKALNTSHHSPNNYTMETPTDLLFAGNNSCILSPEVTEGPYYVSGELIRQNVVEKQEGVPLMFEIQVLDVNTCEPIPGIYVEMWSCNSTGIYGGVAGGNPMGPADDRELNNTMLRGIQQTEKDGVVMFDTIFPGHYTMRTAHIHVMAHINATKLPNNTVTGGTVSHVGQLFFDQSLISEVEAVHPYTSNTQALTTNAQDFIMAQEAANGDPIMEYTYVGSKIENGLFGWMAFGVDPSANRTVNAAATWGKNGGKANPIPAFPGFPPGFSGGFPGFPSGFSFPPFPTNFPMPTNAPRPSVTPTAQPSAPPTGA
ncbi:aromatic compound dioxygenase [Polyplosphaeria fusca]|uniref:Aromatic compound dioxygenase n=1 Tax=Polyplosphaeria fusca TaxID=682080 RepID=A0A9P4V7X8_9PLEO|nr:aromatic compound dioxygenase [Polyplosphaeria fusca]